VTVVPSCSILQNITARCQRRLSAKQPCIQKIRWWREAISIVDTCLFHAWRQRCFNENDDGLLYRSASILVLEPTQFQAYVYVSTKLITHCSTRRSITHSYVYLSATYNTINHLFIVTYFWLLNITQENCDLALWKTSLAPIKNCIYPVREWGGVAVFNTSNQLNYIHLTITSWLCAWYVIWT